MRMTSAGLRTPMAPDAKSQVNRAFWDPRTPPPSASDSEDEENDPSSIADIFADMLSVNEDMILAAAECHADNDIEGTLAYQRILHRNLMEMANYIDSTFGVYGTSATNSSSNSSSNHNADESSLTQVEDAESTEAEAVGVPDALQSDTPGLNSLTSTPGLEGLDKKPSALLDTLEADETLRVIKRSKKRWMKSRHQVREEESVSAIMNETAEKIAAITVAARDDAIESARTDNRPDAPVALSSQDNSESSFQNPAAPQQLPDANSVARALAEKIPIAAAPPAPPAFDMVASLSQLSGMGLLGLLAPDVLARVQMQAQSPGLNMFFPPIFPSFPSTQQQHQQQQQPTLLMGPPSGAIGMPWGNSAMLPAAPAPPPARMVFSRMCADCRNSHYSLHRCRVTLQHTAPEWVPSDTPTAPRKYKRRSKKGTTTE